MKQYVANVLFALAALAILLFLLKGFSTMPPFILGIILGGAMLIAVLAVVVFHYLDEGEN